MSFIVLEGGAEFGGRMADPDRLAMRLAGGPEARICILPTAAAPDNNHRQAGQNGTKWFKRLGASDSDASTERFGPEQEFDLALLKTVKLP